MYESKIISGRTYWYKDSKRIAASKVPDKFKSKKASAKKASAKKASANVKSRKKALVKKTPKKESPMKKVPVKSSLEKQTVVELRKKAKSKGLKGYSKLNKTTLISLLEGELTFEYTEPRPIKSKLLQKQESKAKKIENLLNQRLLHPSFFQTRTFTEIEGPISVYQMSSDKYPHIFYLFGDYHGYKSSCGDITKFHTWIRDTIINSPVFIDVYVETPYSYKDYASVKEVDLQDSYIREFVSYFKRCFEHSKTSEACLTSRFHYTDVRRIFETELHRFIYNLDLFDIFSKDAEYAEDAEYIKDIAEDIKIFNEYINSLVDINSIIHQRIRKQFDAIEDPHVRMFLPKMFESCIKIQKQKIRPLSLHKPNFDDVMKVNRAINDYGMCLMDYYIIARSFRSYKKKDSYSGPSLNNIIYAGNKHIENYTNILWNLGFSIDNNVTNEDDHPNRQCLDISSIKQPLFHQRYKK